MHQCHRSFKNQKQCIPILSIYPVKLSSSTVIIFRKRKRERDSWTRLVVKEGHAKRRQIRKKKREQVREDLIMSSSSSSSLDEESLADLLSKVLLIENNDSGEENEIDGLEDLIPYISGLISSALEEEDGAATAVVEEILDDSMVPFLESVGVPEDRIATAKSVILAAAAATATTNGNDDKTTSATTMSTKLTQDRIVNMSSALHDDYTIQEEENESMWAAASTQVKANANTEMDSFDFNTSAKDRRKAKQDIIRIRREYEIANEIATNDAAQNATVTKSGVGCMILPTEKGNDMDVNLQNISVNLDNGTCLMEKGDLKFTYQRRYAVVGENGVGKTTLLNNIANWEELEGFPKHLRVLHVKQELNTENEETTVINAVLDADIERTQLIQREQQLTLKLEQNNGESGETKEETETTDATAEEFTKDMKELKDVYDRLQLLGADTAQQRASAILTGLQFTDDMQNASIKSLSGGWRMRVALGAALLIEPDILMLDEPTNHLDLEAVVWLEAYLQQYPHTIILVSHDRGFLNEVCTDTIEFKNKKLTYYKGNYDTFVKLKTEQTKNAIREYDAYKSKRDHMMEFITKFRSNAKRATMVQSRVKTVEKMDVDAPMKVEKEKFWRFTIPSSEPLGRPIIAINDVTFDYSYHVKDENGIDTIIKKPSTDYLLQKVNFGVDNSSKIALLGANGQGKTTLLNLIMGHIRPIGGSVTVNSGLRIGHFTQHHSERFDLNLSAIENMLNLFNDKTQDDQIIRSFLGKFQIQGVDALKPMRLLSGGQKSRVSFAVLAYQKPHLLIIDEGSNHLSMDAVDALIQAIQQFKGGLLVVSHDQYFVNKLCNELWVIEDGKATRFDGTFDEYKSQSAKRTKKRVEDSVKKLGNLNN